MRPTAGVLLAALLLVPAASAAFLPADLAPAATQVGPATVYPAWPLLTADLRTLAAEHPDVVRLHSAGASARGLDLWMVEIADFHRLGATPDEAATPLSERHVLWVDGGTHANEYSGVMFVMHFLRFLVEGYGTNETATWIVQNRHTFIVPLVNPEGSMNGVGRLNGNLVNINRNYPVGWGALEEAPLVNNPGPYPASEAETQAVVGAWEAIRPDYMASIHCCGNLWLYPYGIEGVDPHPDDANVYARICEEAYAEVRDDCGPIWSTIYPASGSSVDTAYEQVGAVSFGFEMSGREGLLLWGQPFTTSAAEETESESWGGLLHAFLNVERYGPHPVASVLGVTSESVRLQVRNEGWGNLTRASVSVADAGGVVRTVLVPRLAPGEDAWIDVEGRFAPGAHPVTLAWQKRPLAGDAARNLALVVEPEGRGLAGALVAPREAGVAAHAAGEAATSGPLDVPAPWAAALAALGAVAVALRRRR